MAVMARFRALISCPVIQDSIEEYANMFGNHDVSFDVCRVEQQLSEQELIETINDYDGVLAGDDPFTRRVIESSDRLKVISKWGVGTDNIDKDAAERHGVTVTRTPGTLGDEVADVVIGYAILLARDLHRIDRAVRAGDWITPRGISMMGKTMGIVGVGDAGSAVARRAAGFGMDLLGHDVSPISDGLQSETGIEQKGLESLLRKSDFVSLNCELTEETRSMIGEDELELVGQSGYMINTARGELVDEEALVDALQTDRIAGAALDVYREEPLSSDHPLTTLENTILGSHNAQNTHQAVDRVNELAVENLLSALEAHTSSGHE